MRNSRDSLAALWAWVARAAPGDEDRIFLMSDSNYVLKVNCNRYRIMFI